MQLKPISFSLIAALITDVNAYYYSSTYNYPGFTNHKAAGEAIDAVKACIYADLGVVPKAGNDDLSPSGQTADGDIAHALKDFSTDAKNLKNLDALDQPRVFTYKQK